jgi:glycosyltransferase involved in cell wall biosynthesis
VVTSGHDVADARLHRECAALVRAGLDVEVVGLGTAADAPPGVAHVRALGARGGLLRRAGRAAVLALSARGRVVLTLDPELVPGAYLRRLVRRGPAVVDVHEDYLALLDDRSWARGAAGAGARAVARAANGLAGRVDLTVVADEHVPPATARHRLVVRNLPDLGHLPAPVPRDATPRAVYIGDVRRSRGLVTMLEAVAAAPDWSLDVVGPVAAADQDWLDRWMATEPAAARVRLHGRRPPQESWRFAAGAWAGLALLDDTPAFTAAVPTKLYEYLACGLALVTTPLPRVVELVGTSGAGVVAADAGDVSATLNAWSRDPQALDRCQQAAREWAARHLAGPSPYDVLAARVVELVGVAGEPTEEG